VISGVWQKEVRAERVARTGRLFPRDKQDKQNFLIFISNGILEISGKN
jgi:hypothetical protein